MDANILEAMQRKTEEKKILNPIFSTNYSHIYQQRVYIYTPLFVSLVLVCLVHTSVTVLFR